MSECLGSGRTSTVIPCYSGVRQPVKVVAGEFIVLLFSGERVAAEFPGTHLRA